MNQHNRGLSRPVYLCLTIIAVAATVVTPWFVGFAISLQYEGREGMSAALLGGIVLVWTLLRRFYIAVIVGCFWSALCLLGIASLYGTHVTDSLPPDVNAFFPPRLIAAGTIAFLLGVGTLLGRVVKWSKQKQTPV